MKRPGTTRGDRMLAALMKTPGQVVSRPTLTDAIYPDPNERPATALYAIDTLAVLLRQAGHRIYNRRGEGYWIEAPR